MLSPGSIITLGAALKAAACAALVGSLLGAWGAWQVQGWRLDAQASSFSKAIEDARNQQEARADQAASEHEQHAQAIRTEVQTVIREVPRVVKKPVYRNVCLDADGLQLMARAIGAGGTGQPAPAVPAPDPAR